VIPSVIALAGRMGAVIPKSQKKTAPESGLEKYRRTVFFPIQAYLIKIDKIVLFGLWVFILSSRLILGTTEPVVRSALMEANE
jgi:hypothetical protein